MAAPTNSNSRCNRLLAALPDEAFEQIRPHAETVSLDLKEVLYKAQEPIEYVYFPVDGVISMVVVMDDGAIVEVGTVGNEGMVGIPVFLGSASMPGEAFAQIPGDALRIKSDDFRELVKASHEFRDLLYRYTQALFVQIAQSTACNRLHSAHERCARWLLMSHDRVGADTFPLTQEFLSQMLGVRRPTVSVIASTLQEAGLIRYTRGKITIIDREGLERTSCECYRIIKDEYDRLLGASSHERDR